MHSLGNYNLLEWGRNGQEITKYNHFKKSIERFSRSSSLGPSHPRSSKILSCVCQSAPIILFPVF